MAVQRKPPFTARETLIEVAGETHAEHTIVDRLAQERGVIPVRCSCGALVEIPATKENTHSIRNVAPQQRS